MGIFKRLKESIRYHRDTADSERFIEYLRRCGVSVGRDVIFYEPRTMAIDTTKPCLISIGNSVRVTRGVVILTHGADWHVLRELYHTPFGSAGEVIVEDNVFLGNNCIVLKGVTIGRNSIIGAGSVVTRSIPPGTVAAGNPARPIMSIEEYYEKRKGAQLREAQGWARAIFEKHGRLPVPDDFSEFFELFLKRDPRSFGKIPVMLQVGKHYRDFLESKPMFDSFEDFLRSCGLPASAASSSPGPSE